MQPRLSGTLLLLGAISCLSISAQASIESSGVLNFNVGEPPTQTNELQGVTLYGCHHDPISLKVSWGKNNQIHAFIPYGPRTTRIKDTTYEYFMGKFYVASPPAFTNPQQKAGPHIGLITPDRFTFTGKKPAQILNFDYQVLEQTNIKEVPVDFKHSYKTNPSCASAGVNLIPINTACHDFPWQSGALGASGIGELANGTKNNKSKTLQSSSAFLPFNSADQPLKCNVTLLDDIILTHKVYFDTPAGLSKTIDLTDYYTNNKTMNLVCLPRDKGDIPLGCANPNKK